MNILDTRTIMLSYLITNALSAMVTFSLWRQNRRLPGLHFWLADFLMQFIGIMLILLRGSVSDFLSMVVSNTLLIGGLLALLIGFEKYTDRISAQWLNYFGLVVFFAIQAYFSLAQPNLQFRNINIAVFIMLFSLQSAWLLLRRADVNLRQDARSTGLILVGFGVLSLFRILVDLVIHPGNDFFKSGFYDSIILMSYQTLYLSLTFSLFLLVNRRLNLILQNDLTQLNLAAASLRASEEKFSKAFQTSPFAVTITNPRNGRFLEVNDAFCAITGYSREEALNSTTLSLNLWVNLAERVDALEMLKTNLKVWGREIQFRKKNGEIFVSLFSCQNIQWGQEICVFASIEDISERKQAETQKRLIAEVQDFLLRPCQLEDIYRLVSEKVNQLIGDGITATAFLDEKNKTIRMASYHGLDLPFEKVLEVIGFDPWKKEFALEALPPEINQMYRRNRLNSLEGGLYTLIAHLVPKPACLLVEKLLRVKKVYGMGFIHDDEYLGGLAILARGDLTCQIATIEQVVNLATIAIERKRAEAALSQLNAELELRVEARTSELRDAQEQLVQQERLAVLGRVADSVSQELRNPLGIINNAIYYLRLVQPEADEPIKQYLGIIEAETHNADKIVSDLLDFSSNQLADREAITVPDLVQRTLDGFTVPENVRVTLKLPEKLPALYVDPHQMTQVLGNLVLNACQAMNDEGRLTVDSRQSTVDGQSSVVIAVKDTGTGITPENMKKLFEPLFTTKPKGIGLGLAVSKKLAEANGGRIEVESEAGKGSVFTLWLPVHSVIARVE